MEGFCDLVHEVWDNTIAIGSHLERWQAKIRRLRQYLRGWQKILVEIIIRRNKYC
jgi:hypothetical protein